MKNKKLKVWHKIFIGILFFLIVILFLTPRIARKYIVNNSTELIGRKIDIQKIRINYFTGVLRIKELSLYEQDKTSIFIHFNKLLVNLDYWLLFKNELYISEIRLDDFYTQVEQNGDWFNFSDLSGETDTLNIEEPKDTIAEDPMILSFNNITISNSEANYTDHLLNHTISLGDINLFVPGFTLNSGSTNLAVNFDFIQGGRLNSTLNFNQSDSTYSIGLNLDSLNLDIIEPYIKNSMDIAEINGYFTNKILLKGNLQHIMQIHMKGWNKIQSFEMIDNQNRNVLSFDEFKIDIDTFLLQKNEIRINEIALVNPAVLVELIDSTNNWSAMIIPSDSIPADTVIQTEETVQENKEIIYSLAKLDLSNGEVLFRNKTLSRDFEALIHNFNISSSDINEASSEVDVKLTAELNKTAKINSDFKINPQNMKDMEVDFSLQKFAMKDVEPYFYHYFGYEVEEGLFNFTTSNVLRTSSFNSENNIYIRKLELERENKKDAQYKLPVKLAVGIMSDKNGIIDLNVPVENKGEQTSIGNVGKLILKTFSNLIAKAATSPADFLANLYGVNPEKIKEIKTGIFDNELTEENMETLDLVANILKDKPKLACEFQYNIDKNKYFDSLATSITLNEFKETASSKKNTKDINSTDSLFRAFVTKKLDKEEGHEIKIEDLCVQYVGKENLSARLDSTEKIHFNLVDNYLTKHKSIGQNRIRIKHENSDSLITNKSMAVFKMYFKSQGGD